MTLNETPQDPPPVLFRCPSCGFVITKELRDYARLDYPCRGPMCSKHLSDYEEIPPHEIHRGRTG